VKEIFLLLATEITLWSKHLRDNFDKLIVFVLTVAMLAWVTHMVHQHVDLSHISWGRETTGLVIGTLMGLVGGRAIGKLEAKAEQKPDGNNPGNP
jgi:hypothetical protein